MLEYFGHNSIIWSLIEVMQVSMASKRSPLQLSCWTLWEIWDALIPKNMKILMCPEELVLWNIDSILIIYPSYKVQSKWFKWLWKANRVTYDFHVLSFPRFGAEQVQNWEWSMTHSVNMVVPCQCHLGDFTMPKLTWSWHNGILAMPWAMIYVNKCYLSPFWDILKGFLTLDLKKHSKTYTFEEENHSWESSLTPWRKLGCKDFSWFKGFFYAFQLFYRFSNFSCVCLHNWRLNAVVHGLVVNLKLRPCSWLFLVIN